MYFEQRSLISWTGAVLGFLSGGLLIGGLLHSNAFFPLVFFLAGLLILLDCLFSSHRAQQHLGTVLIFALLGVIAEVILFAAQLDTAYIALAFALSLVILLISRFQAQRRGPQKPQNSAPQKRPGKAEPPKSEPQPAGKPPEPPESNQNSRNR